MRPQWLGELVEIPVSGRDLMLAVDVSGSMKARDMQVDGVPVDRLTAVKQVLDTFLSRRDGDRVGLILFGTNAYLQAPLTFDLETVNRLQLILGFITLGVGEHMMVLRAVAISNAMSS